MNRDNKRAPEEKDDDFASESHAADEPTAVWDEKALRAAGLTDLLHQRASDPPAPPATPAPDAPEGPSIVVDESLTPGAPQRLNHPDLASPQGPAPRAGFGWPATVSIALLLGALVYALIRFLKG